MASNDHPPIRNDIIDSLHDMLSNVISHYLKNHKDVTNEELDCVFNRLLSFHEQQKIHLYALYVWDLKQDEERADKKKGQSFTHIQ